MKTLIFFGLSILLNTGCLFAQNSFTTVLSEIENNNTTLKALRQQSEAGKLNSRTGIYLQNPEAGLNYLWGKPGEIGNRTDLSITQSFDFPSAYKYKGNIADLQMGQAELEYQVHRIDLLYEVSLVCVDLVYYKKLLAENKLGMEYAHNIADAVGKMYEQGKVGILENNKAQLIHANAVNDNALLEATFNELIAELIRYNGGEELKNTPEDFPAVVLQADFEEWFAMVEANNPLLQYMSRKVEISENEEKLHRAMSLPKFSAGYMSEKIVGEQYQGVSVGMSIPLWENKNTVKAARARTAASIALMDDSRVQLYNKLKNRYRKAIELQEAAEAYTSSLLNANSTKLLKRAYDMGEISLIEYHIEVQFYYEALVRVLETERKMHKAVVELEKWEAW